MVDPGGGCAWLLGGVVDRGGRAWLIREGGGMCG